MNNDTSDLAIELISLYEGIKLKPYKDATGIPTIGIGNCYYEDGTKVSMQDKPITEKRANELLGFALTAFHDHSRLAFGVKLWESLDSFQQAAILAFVYNCGLGTMKKCRFFKNMKAEGGVTPTTHQELATSVVTAGGQVLKGLQRRRLAESLVFQGTEPIDSYREAKEAFP